MLCTRLMETIMYFKVLGSDPSYLPELDSLATGVSGKSILS